MDLSHIHGADRSTKRTDLRLVDRAGLASEQKLEIQYRGTDPVRSRDVPWN